MTAGYQEVFDLIDADGSGALDLDEVRTFCEKLPNSPPAQVIARLFVQADADQSGAIDRIEFCALCEGIKLLINMSEKQIVDAYATHEIKRLFSYLCTMNGQSMRRDELRKVLDVLNEGLELHHPDSFITAQVQSTSTTDVDFEAFREMLFRFCPNKPLTKVASVFLEEERRRKMRLNKVKSMYEKKGTGTEERPEEWKCRDCPAKDSTIERLQMEVMNLTEALSTLKKQESDANAYAVKEVQYSAQIGRLQGQLSEFSDKMQVMDSMATALRHALSEKDLKITSLEKVIESGGTVQEERDSLLVDIAALQGELANVKQELQNAQERAFRKGQENADLQQTIERNRQRLQEKEDRLQEMAKREFEVQVKEAESLRMQRMMMEMRDRCDRREAELTKLERQVEATNSRMAERTKALEEREDAVTSQERNVRRYELESQEKWENVFRKAQVELDLQQESLNVRELEVVHKEAELTVREQLFESNQRKAENTSLPERDRRLKLLQNIERDLASRERQLRTAERAYLDSIVHPELEVLREENKDLQRQVLRLRLDLQSETQRLKDESERNAAERQKWIERSKLSIAQEASGGGSSAGGAPGLPNGSFRKRSQSIVGKTPAPVLNLSGLTPPKST
jgi:Ca2+-binding EF-hand superfamily protein